NGKGQQTCRRPSSPCSPVATSNRVLWNYLPNGLLASRTDQQGQLINYTYDADRNLLTAHDASGITDSSQTPVDTQNTYDDLDRLVRSDLKKQSETNWTFSSFAFDLNGNLSDLDQNGQESSPNGSLVKDGHKLHNDYDGANWLADQIDSTLNQRVLNSFTPIGLEHSREIDQSNGSGGWTQRQTTTWEYFANGKLSKLTTSVPGQAQPIEQHAVSYLDQSSCGSAPPPSCGIYIDGNRTQDQFSLRPGNTAGSPGTRVAGTATYSYDPRDRLLR